MRTNFLTRKSFMEHSYPKLNLKQFSQGYEAFRESVVSILRSAERVGVIDFMVSDDVYAQYKVRRRIDEADNLFSFLKETYLVEEQEMFLSFCNNIIKASFSNQENFFQKSEKIVSSMDDATPEEKVFKDLCVLLYEQLNNPNVFDVDFYYDVQDEEIKRKLDSVTIEMINSNIDKFDDNDGNGEKYEACVAEFLSFKGVASSKTFYNTSLDNLKRVVENTLQNKYKDKHGKYPKLNKVKEITNILFDNRCEEFEGLVTYVVQNIHHERDGFPKQFTPKEYTFLWLQLNLILFLLHTYTPKKKSEK
jgi:hypothetical protein